MSLTLNSWAQPVFNNVYDYGLNLTEAATQITEFGNNYYVSGGHNYGFSTNSSSVLLKVDEFGQEVFYSKFDLSSSSDGIYSTFPKGDKIYCFGALIDTSENITVGYNSFMLVLDTATGDSTYFKDLNFGYYDGISDVIEYDNGFLVQGFIYNNVANDYNYTFLSHIDTLGNVISYQEFGDGLGYHFAYDFKRTDDGGVVIAGQTNDYPIENRNQLWLLKLDSNFHEEFYQEYGDTAVDETIRTFNYLELTHDGGYMIGGQERVFDNNVSSVNGFFTKIDAAGIVEWKEEILHGFYANVKSIRLVNQKEIIVTGGFTLYDSINLISEDPRGYLVKYTPDGQTLIWERYFSKWWGIPTNQDYVHDMILTSDGGILISGYQIHALPTWNDAWLIKFDSCGYTTNNPTEALLVVDSIVNATVFISNLSSDYCTGKYLISNQNGILDSLDVYAYSQWTNGVNPNQMQYTFQDTGAYEITISVIGGDSTDSYTVQFNILDTVSSVNPSVAWENQIKIFPNPVKDYLVIQNDFSLNNSTTETLSCTIYTTTGQAIKSFDLDPSLFQQRIFIDDIANGVYLLNFTADRPSVGNKRLSVVR